MPRSHCPRCGGLREDAQPDPLARCVYCGALLADAGEFPLLVARPRVDAEAARRRVARALLRAGHRGWRTSAPELALYPFSREPSARRPLRPLAALPPLLAEAWRPSGADLRAEELSDDPLLAGAARVPMAEDPPEGRTVVLYPFLHIPLGRADESTAAWCDAVDGQVLLPEPLREGAPLQATRLARGCWAALIAGLCLGLALPAPFSWVAAVAAGGGWWMVKTR